MKTFDALWVDLVEKDKRIDNDVRRTNLEQLSMGDTILQVHYSSINYKDALAMQYRTGVIQKYPMIPGIDLAGVILEAPSDAHFKPGDKVIVTGYETGVSHTGGFSEIARIPQEWMVPLPQQLSLKEAMIYGTAGFTAALAIHQLERHGMQLEQQPEILVTGASGGVGSLAVAMLHQLGYKNITAISRKQSAIKFLKTAGAKSWMTPDEWIPESIRPLGKQSVHFVIDTVGGKLLSAILPHIHYQGAVSLCGNAGGINIDTTVLPFILRGIHLLGIDSVQVSRSLRNTLWREMATTMKPVHLVDFMTNEVGLTEISNICQSLLEGPHHGRTIVQLKNRKNHKFY